MRLNPLFMQPPPTLKERLRERRELNNGQRIHRLVTDQPVDPEDPRPQAAELLQEPILDLRAGDALHLALSLCPALSRWRPTPWM